MNLLAINSARSIWLVNTIFFNPRGRNVLGVVADLVGRYQFVKFPQASQLVASPMNLKFEGGSFVDASGQPIFVNLSIHDDGFIAETRASTDESDRFLNDALSWAAATYQLAHYSELEVQRLYASEIIANLELPERLFSEAFTRFIRRMQRGVSNNPSLAMEITGLHFGPDPQATKRTAPFRVERVAGAEFAAKQYYCTAPVPTSEHLQLLREMEEAAVA